MLNVPCFLLIVAKQSTRYIQKHQSGASLSPPDLDIDLSKQSKMDVDLPKRSKMDVDLPKRSKM